MVTPYRLDAPVWADDPHFDIDFHLRRAALPKPGGRRELSDYVQRVISRPLDRTKPLWEIYFIEGLEDGHVAVLSKVHHCMIDGMAAMDIASVMFDFSPDPQILAPQEWHPEPEPTRADLMREAAYVCAPGVDVAAAFALNRDQWRHGVRVDPPV